MKSQPFKGAGGDPALAHPRAPLPSSKSRKQPQISEVLWGQVHKHPLQSLSEQEAKADERFGWTDGEIFHFSLAVMAKGFCCEQEILTGIFPQRFPLGSGRSWQHQAMSWHTSCPRCPRPGQCPGTHAAPAVPDQQCMSIPALQGSPFTPCAFTVLTPAQGGFCCWHLHRDTLAPCGALRWPSHLWGTARQPLGTRRSSHSVPGLLLPLMLWQEEGTCPTR